MKKSDLKNGMWVRLRNGVEMMVLTDVLTDSKYKDKENVFVSKKNWDSFSNYNEDLSSKSGFETLDIVEVFNTKYFNLSYAKKHKESIWIREKKILEKDDLKKIEAIKICYPDIRYLTKNSYGNVVGFFDKPSKTNYCWKVEVEDDIEHIKVDLTFLSWEDDEPYEIK